MDWIPIGEEVQLLTANQQRIRDMLDDGKSIWSICGIMRMRREHVTDEIYEIRKKEANMSKAPVSGKLSPQQKAAIYQAYKDGAKQQELADQYGVCNQAISYTIKRMREAEKSMAAAVELPAAAQLPAPESEKKPASVINPEFDAAVDQMIAEMHDAKAEKNAANAEEKSVIAEVPEPVPDPEPDLEDCENGIPNTPLVPDVIPPVIRRLINDGIGYMESKISEYEDQIEEIQAIIDEYRKDIEKAKAWKEQQKWR